MKKLLIIPFLICGILVAQNIITPNSPIKIAGGPNTSSSGSGATTVAGITDAGNMAYSNAVPTLTLATNQATVVSNGVVTFAKGLTNNFIATNDTRSIVLTGTTNNLGGDVSGTHFYGTFSGSSGTNTGLLSAHAVATDSNGKFIAAALIESDITSLVTDLSQRVTTNETRNLVFTSVSNNIGGDVSATHFYGTYSGSTGTNTGLLSAHATATDSNGKFIAAALVESDITSLVTDLSQRVTTNETRNLVFTSSSNNIGGDVAATHFYGTVSASSVTNTGLLGAQFVGTDANGKKIASTAIISSTIYGFSTAETFIQATPNYMRMSGAPPAAGATTEANVSQAIFQQGYFTNLWWNENGILTSTNVTCTLMTNGVASNLASTIVGTGGLINGFDSTHGVPLTGASNNVSLKFTSTNPSVSAAVVVNWSIRFVSYP